MGKQKITRKRGNGTKQSEQRLLALMRATSDVIYRMSPDWKTMTELYGRGFLADTQKPDLGWLDKYIHPEDQAYVTGVIQSCIDDKRMFELEHRVLKADGSIGWTYSRAVPLLDENGEIQEWFGAASDVTGRKQAEEALRESEAKYHDLFNSIDEGFCIIEVLFDGDDQPIDYRFLEVNKSFERQTGIANATGRCMRAISPDHEQQWFDIYGHVALTGEPVRFQNPAQSLGFFYDVYAYRVGKPELRRVAILFNDITDRKKTEEALRESEERYRKVVQNTSAVILRLSPQGIIRFANRQALEFFGYREDEFIGKPALGTFVPEWETTGRDLARMVQEISENPNRFHNNANENIRKNGERVWMEWTNTGIYDTEGRMKEFLAVGIDATGRKRAEEEIKKASGELEKRTREVQNERQRFFNVLETLPVMICLITPDYHIPFANKAFRERFGEANGRCCYDYCCGYTEPCTFCESLTPLKTGQPHHWEFTSPDGNTIIDAYDFPFSDMDGSPLILEMNIDITERKRAEDALLEKSRQLEDANQQKEDILASIYDCFYALDKEFRFTYANKAAEEIWGIPRAKLLGRRIEDVFPGLIDLSLSKFRRALEEQTPQHYEVFSKVISRWGDMSVHPTRDGISIFFRDTTERKRAEEALRESEAQARALAKKLEEADRNKNQFISALSHELRNPLAVTLTGLELLCITEDQKQLASTKEILNRQMKQICALVDDLMDLTRISNNRVELKKERTELNRLAILTAEDQQGLFQGKGVRLHTETGRPLYLDADPVRLKQIIGNLLHNALKYTNAGGEAALSVFEEGGEAVVSVKDNGIGLDPDILPRLFEPFVQADMSLDRSGGGLGLGLSITKGIAELHGGSVSAKSAGLGKGSEFIIRLPIVDMMEQDKADGKKRTDAGTHTLKILIIEDNRDFADLMCAMLTPLGYQVMVSYNGCEGVEKAKQFQPDIIFCDIGLPGMDGFAVSKAIKENSSPNKPVIVALTGYAGEDIQKRAKESGFDRHIAKPVSLAALKQFLNAY